MITPNLKDYDKLQGVYLSFTKLKDYNECIYFQKNKLKIRLFNTNEPFASIKANLPHNVKLQKEITEAYGNITKSRTDYIDGKSTSNRKIDLIIDPHKEHPEDYIIAIELCKESMSIDKYEQLIAFTYGLGV